MPAPSGQNTSSVFPHLHILLFTGRLTHMSPLVFMYPDIPELSIQVMPSGPAITSPTVEAPQCCVPAHPPQYCIMGRAFVYCSCPWLTCLTNRTWFKLCISDSVRPFAYCRFGSGRSSRWA